MKKAMLLFWAMVLGFSVTISQTLEPGTVENPGNLNVTGMMANGLTQLYSVNGNYSLSADGAGSLSASHSIDVEKPNELATVHKAFLFCAPLWGNSSNCTQLNGTAISWDGDSPAAWGCCNYYADVTDIVAPIIDPAAAGVTSIPLFECSSIDGYGLVVIFSDELAPERTMIIMFGGLSTTGDNFAINLAEPIDPDAPGAVFDMGLGISYGAQGNCSSQYSIIDINGQRLTTSAGGEDDGSLANGALITVGGIGDSNENPADPFALPNCDPTYDDELYDILPFITSSTTSLEAITSNPSNDDNVFLAYFNISGAAIIGEGILISQTASSGFVGTDHTVKAAVFNDLGDPVADREVVFEVISGPNAGDTYTGNTNVDGEVFFTYTGDGGVGFDQIEACFMNSMDEETCSNILTFEWIEEVADCVNPSDGGLIGYDQSNSMAFDPDPLVSLTPATGFVGNLEYKWQYSTDGMNFMDIESSNAESYDPETISQTTWFKRLARVDCQTDWSGAAESNTLQMTIEGDIEVTITESPLPFFCQGQGVVLTASSMPNPAASFLWSTGEMTESIFVDMPGMYSVDVVDDMGNSGSASYEVDFEVSELLSSYTLLAKDQILLLQSNVHSGGIGVMEGLSNRILGLAYTKALADNTFGKAPVIYTDGGSTITNKIFASADIAWPEFKDVVANGTEEVVVPSYSTMTLSGSSYKSVYVGKYATVTFTEPMVEINDFLSLKWGSTVKFEQCTEVMIGGVIKASPRININPDELSVVFYVFGDATFGGGATVNASIYLKEGNLGISDSKETTPASFKGLFLSNRVWSGKHTNWYMNEMCNVCSIDNLKVASAPDPIADDEAQLTISNYPNPFSEKTTFSVVSTADDNITLEIYNLSGSLIQSLYSGKLTGNTMYEFEFNASDNPEGLYIYKLISKNGIQSGKVVLQK